MKLRVRMPILLAGFALALVCPPAHAHAMLEQAVPPVGSTVPSAPGELRLSFSEALEPRFCRIAVTDASGAPMNAGAIRTDPADPSRLLVPVRALRPGTYGVSWHAVSVDTHRTEGSYRFTVGP